MRTFKEFKDAGVVFVIGDKCKDNAFSYTKKWVLDKSKDFDVCELTEFAWRYLTTKPDNPKFKIELDIANHRWRPSLNQGEEWPDEQRIDVIGQNGNDGTHYDNTAQQFEALVNDKPAKPVFTQAMADAGELPPVGSKVKVCIEEAGFELEGNDPEHEGKVVTIKAAFVNKYGKKLVAIENDKGNCACYIIECIKPIIKTIKVNGFDVPAPMSEAPMITDEYFTPQTGYAVFYCANKWCGDEYDRRFLSRGLVHATKESAIAHAKAMLGIDPNEQA